MPDTNRTINENLSAAEKQGETMPTHAHTDVLDRAAALDRLGGDERLLAEIAGLFLQEYPAQLEAIRDAVQAASAPELERAAHSLKGSVANFAAPAVFQAAFALEQMAHEGGLEYARGALQNLEERLEGLHAVLARIATGSHE